MDNNLKSAAAMVQRWQQDVGVDTAAFTTAMTAVKEANEGEGEKALEEAADEALTVLVVLTREASSKVPALEEGVTALEEGVREAREAAAAREAADEADEAVKEAAAAGKAGAFSKRRIQTVAARKAAADKEEAKIDAMWEAMESLIWLDERVAKAALVNDIVAMLGQDAAQEVRKAAAAQENLVTRTRARILTKQTFKRAVEAVEAALTAQGMVDRSAHDAAKGEAEAAEAADDAAAEAVAKAEAKAEAGEMAMAEAVAQTVRRRRVSVEAEAAVEAVLRAHRAHLDAVDAGVGFESRVLKAHRDMWGALKTLLKAGQSTYQKSPSRWTSKQLAAASVLGGGLLYGGHRYARSRRRRSGTRRSKGRRSKSRRSKSRRSKSRRSKGRRSRRR